MHSHISPSVYFTAFVHGFNLEIGHLAFPAVWDFPSCPMSASKSHILHSKQSGHGCPWSLHYDHCRRGLDHYPIIDSFLIFVGLHQFWGRESHITSGAPLLCSIFLVLGASQPPFWTQFSQHQYLHLPHGISTFAYVAAVGVDLAIAEVLLHVVAVLPAVVVAPLVERALVFLGDAQDVDLLPSAECLPDHDPFQLACGGSVSPLPGHHFWQFSASCSGAHLGDHKLEVGAAHPAQYVVVLPDGEPVCAFVQVVAYLEVADSIRLAQPPLGDALALVAILAGDPDVDPVSAVAADGGPIQPVQAPLGDGPALSVLLVVDLDVDPIPVVAADGGPIRPVQTPGDGPVWPVPVFAADGGAIQPVQTPLGDGPTLSALLAGDLDVDPIPVVAPGGGPIHPVQTPGDGPVWPPAVFPEGDAVQPVAFLFDASAHHSAVVVGDLPVHVFGVDAGHPVPMLAVASDGPLQRPAPAVVGVDGDLLARLLAVLVDLALPSSDSMSWS